MRVRLLDRYLLADFFRIFGLCALSGPLLFILADATEHLEAYLTQGATADQLVLYYWHHLPLYLTWTLPLAALVATMFTLHPLTKHGEVVAWLANGVPVRRLFLPLVFAGTAITVLDLAIPAVVPRFGTEGAPAWGTSSATAGVRRAFAYLTDAGDLMNARELDGTAGRMSDVVIQPGASSEAPTSYLVAATANWVEGKGWVLHDGYRCELLPDGRERVTGFRALVAPGLTESPNDLLEARSADVDGMTFAEMGKLADRLDRSGSPTGFVRTKQWERITIPLIALVVILFTAPLATIAGRREGHLGVGLSLVATILYLSLLRTSEALGYSGILSPGVAACLPLVVFGGLGWVLLRRVPT